MKTFRSMLPFFLVFALHGALAEEVTLKIGSRTVRAEIADTQQSRERGLMRRDNLCDDCGMLFVFENAGRYSFWMKNTPLPLSIAFIAADGSIINIEEMLPNTTETHDAKRDALYALEMKSGWYTRNGIQPALKVPGLERIARAH